MKTPIITEDKIVSLFETKFLRLFDIQYSEGKHYFNATRHRKNELTCIKTEEEFKKMLPDAVTCFVILKIAGKEPKLLMSYEFRYPTGRYLLSPPAGLIDKTDKADIEPLISTAKREIFEETGIRIKDTDTIYTLNSCLFSTPGMTDESNGIVVAVVDLEDISLLTHNGAEGSECFDGFILLGKKEAEAIMKSGIDNNGHAYSVYTWCALMYFVSDAWNN